MGFDVWAQRARGSPEAAGGSASPPESASSLPSSMSESVEPTRRATSAGLRRGCPCMRVVASCARHGGSKCALSRVGHIGHPRVPSGTGFCLHPPCALDLVCTHARIRRVAVSAPMSCAPAQTGEGALPSLRRSGFGWQEQVVAFVFSREVSVVAVGHGHSIPASQDTLSLGRASRSLEL